MDSIQTLIDSTSGPGTAFAGTLDRDSIQVRTPAALATQPDPRTSPTYKFLPTERVISALSDAGFLPVTAIQARGRTANPMSARHVIRFRRRYESVQLRDCIPEILFLNSHDGRTATQFRLALFRPICTNGLIVCDEQMPVWRIPHRGDILDEVISAAIKQSEQFAEVGKWVERMERTVLEPQQRLKFASDAIDLRFPKRRPLDLAPENLLEVKREQDEGVDLWRTYNVIQEHVVKGGLEYRTPSKRKMVSRGIRAIREDVRLNSALWTMATALAA